MLSSSHFWLRILFNDPVTLLIVFYVILKCCFNSIYRLCWGSSSQCKVWQTNGLYSPRFILCHNSGPLQWCSATHRYRNWPSINPHGSCKASACSKQEFHSSIRYMWGYWIKSVTHNVWERDFYGARHSSRVFWNWCKLFHANFIVILLSIIETACTSPVQFLYRNNLGNNF